MAFWGQLGMSCYFNVGFHWNPFGGKYLHWLIDWLIDSLIHSFIHFWVWCLNWIVLGPLQIPKMLLLRETPMLPASNFGVVDVRDVATSHLRAMTIPEAAGQRFVLWTSNMWLKDFASVCILRLNVLLAMLKCPEMRPESPPRLKNLESFYSSVFLWCEKKITPHR